MQCHHYVWHSLSRKRTFDVLCKGLEFQPQANVNSTVLLQCCMHLILLTSWHLASLKSPVPFFLVYPLRMVIGVENDDNISEKCIVNPRHGEWWYDYHDCDAVMVGWFSLRHSSWRTWRCGEREVMSRKAACSQPLVNTRNHRCVNLFCNDQGM